MSTSARSKSPSQTLSRSSSTTFPSPQADPVPRQAYLGFFPPYRGYCGFSLVGSALEERTRGLFQQCAQMGLTLCRNFAGKEGVEQLALGEGCFEAYARSGARQA